MTDLHQLQFYATPEHPCSYLPGRQAKTLFVDPKARVSQQDYTILSELGFRRSGTHLYRPHCAGCRACISARVDVARFKPSKNQRRIMRRNRQLSFRVTSPHHSDEVYALYESYINERHADGDMHPASADQFESFLVNSAQQTRFMEFRDRDRLIAVAVIDLLKNGISAIYTFFDPHEHQRSLGVYAILSQIEYSRCENLNHLYLGYWIHDCRKMAYKIRYQPVELLIDGTWTEIAPRLSYHSEITTKPFDL